MLIGIQKDDININWPLIAPFIENALLKTKNKEFSSDSIREFLESGDMQLWAWMNDGEIDAIGVSEIVIYPNRKLLSVPFAAANKMTIEEWFEKSIDVLEHFAKHHGCSGLKGYGRKGWLKHFRKRGNVREETHFILEF